MQKITADELKRRRRPTLDLEIAPGETITLTLRPVSQLEMAKLGQETRSLFSEAVPNDALPRPEGMQAALSEQQVYAANDYIFAVCVAGVLEPKLSMTPSEDALTPYDLEPLGAPDKDIAQMPNVMALFRAVMDLSGYGDRFRPAERADDGRETAVPATTPADGTESGQPGSEIPHRPLDSSELGLGTV